MVVNTGDTTYVYFADDQKVIDDLLRDAKSNKQMQLRDEFNGAIKTGYTSNATSIDVNYSIDTEDMLDLGNLIALGQPANYREKGGKFKAHTLPQLKQVRDEGTAYKFEQYQKYETLMDAINTASTIEDLEPIVW